MIVSKTPLRISFAGGGTDFPSFYRENDYGAVLSTTIDSYIYVAVKKHTSLFDEHIRLNYSETELVNRIDDIKNDIIRECLRFLEIDDRIYISTIADVPAMSGLGSSSAFCVGLLNALYRYKGMSVPPGRLAEEAVHIEIDILKRPIGKQDHYAAAFGGLNLFVFHADETVAVKLINLNDGFVRELAESMISFWTGQMRVAASVLHEQNSNTEKNRETLIAMRNQTEELLSLLRNVCSIEQFGKLIHEGWEMKRKLASKITNAVIDEYYETALKNEAYGGKISGAGGGGFLHIFALPEKHPQIVSALRPLGLVDYKFYFETQGTSVFKFE